MSETIATRLNNNLTEGVLLALASAYVYLVTFFYESGYCSNFNIPAAFISPNLTTILVAAAAIGSLIIPSFQIFGFSVPLLRAGTHPSETQKPFRNFFLLNSLVLTTALFALLVYGISKNGFIFFAVVALILNFFFFGIGLIIHRKKTSLSEKFAAMQKSEDEVFDISSLLIEKFGKARVLTVIYSLIIFAAAYAIGDGEAKKQRRFLILKNHKDYVLLRTYGDVLIAAPFDRTKKIVKPELMLLRVSSKEEIEFTSEMVGPLVVEPVLVMPKLQAELLQKKTEPLKPIVTNPVQAKPLEIKKIEISKKDNDNTNLTLQKLH